MKKIIYIIGVGQSGSTLLDTMLDSSDGVFGMSGPAVLPVILKKNTMHCSCGAPSRACPVWGAVAERIPPEEWEDLGRWADFISKERNLHRFLRPGRTGKSYAELNDEIFEAAFEVTGADTLVDSSKNLSRAFALLHHSRYDLHFLHLIRDSRGYINGINKNRRRQGLKTRAFVRPFGRWLIKNAGASLLGAMARPGRFISVHFEDMLLEPARTLERIGGFTGKDLSGTVSTVRGEVPFTGYHVLAGNPQIRGTSEGWGKVRLDPSFVGRNRLEGMNPTLFWLLGGWLSRFWGYTRGQEYLQQAGEDRPAPAS